MSRQPVRVVVDSVRPIGVPLTSDSRHTNASHFARNLCLKLTAPNDHDEPFQVFLLCRRVSSRSQLQALLWDANLMSVFVRGLCTGGVVIMVSARVAGDVTAWFGEKVVTVQDVSCREPIGFRVLNLVLGPMISNPQYSVLLQKLMEADFVCAENEHFIKADHFRTKVRSWFTAGHCAVVDDATGVEYFAQCRSRLWMIVSIGVQSASNKGTVTLHDFVYENMELNHSCFQDRLGRGTGVLAPLRSFLADVIAILGGPSLSLIHDIHLDSCGTFHYAKIELCRDVRVEGHVEEARDLSYISPLPRGFTISSTCNEIVAAEAMRCIHNDKHEDLMGKLIESESCPVEIYLEYDIAKAVRVIPNTHAVMRRRYAGLLSRRERNLSGIIPDLSHAQHPTEQKTSLIRSVDAEGYVVQYGLPTIAIMSVISAALTGAIVFAISRDSDVNAADMSTLGLTSIAFLMITLPQLYVSFIGDGYSIAELYRGRVPLQRMLKLHGVGFLRECVAEGVAVENAISGRNACFLMGRATGRLPIGPVRLQDLDDRWDYGISGNGALCMRYKGIVADMQVIQRSVGGRQRRWWHCAVLGNHIRKGMGTDNVKEILGNGEVG